MKRWLVLGWILWAPGLLIAQKTIEVTNITINQMENDLLSVSVEIRNRTGKSVSEIEGVLDFYDNFNRVILRRPIQIVHVYDVPFAAGESRRREVVVSRLPNMAGTVRYRITGLRLFGEQEIYLVCPNCGELILKE